MGKLQGQMQSVLNEQVHARNTLIRSNESIEDKIDDFMKAMNSRVQLVESDIISLRGVVNKILSSLTPIGILATLLGAFAAQMFLAFSK